MTQSPAPSATNADRPLEEAEWHARLTPAQYHVLREGGTEPRFSGAYTAHKGDGVYHCAGCGLALFDSGYKYESGSGWPSFTRPADPQAVSEHHDHTHDMVRTEVRCAACSGHLGHVFPDAPLDTGLRYCINSASLAFQPRQTSDA